MSASQTNSDRKNIVVVGGGQAGVVAARTLSKTLDATKYNVVLINPLPYRVLLPATLRVTVSDRDDLEKQIFVPYDKVFHENNGEFIQAAVTSIQTNEGVKVSGGTVVLDNGRRVPYLYLVLASGSTWPGPSSFPNDEQAAKEYINRSRALFEKAKHIVIIGGGAIGIETAGEIRDVWKDKKITLVHGGPQLLNDAYPSKFRSKAESSVKARNIDLILGDAVENIRDIQTVQGITTRNGISLPDVDLAVSCVGPRPNTGFIASSLGSSTLSQTGHVHVEPTLQLVSHPNIFAAGDIIEWKEQKQAAKAKPHVAIVAYNILALLTNKPVKPYTGTFEGIVVTNGKNGGFGYLDTLWGITLGDWAAKTIKSKTLFVGPMRADSGY